MQDALRFLRSAMRSHCRAAFLAATATAALSVLATRILPGTWYVQASILAQPEPVTASLANPGRMLPSDFGAELSAAMELLSSRDNLLSLVQKTQLLSRWRASRAPLPALKDRIVRRLFGEPREEDEVEALVDLVRKKLRVSIDDEVVTIGIEWPEPRSAHALVTGAQQAFVETQHVRETALFAGAIAILQARVDVSGQEKSAALHALEQQAGGVHRAIAAPPRPTPEPGRASIAASRAALERSQARHERLVERLEQAKLEREAARASFPRRFAVVRPAAFPREPVRPKPASIVLGALLGALGLALFGAVMAELRPHRRAAIAVVTAVLAAASALGLALTGHPAAAIAPPVLAAAACAMFLLPLRHTALAFLFLMLSLEGPGDASGLWSSPWAPVGHLLNTNLNSTLPIEALRFTGADLIFAGLLLVIALRRMTFSAIDAAGSLPSPRPLRIAALVSLGAILLLIAWGIARGGSPQQTLWQCHVFALVPVFFFVLSAALRGPEDFPALGKTVLLAAVVKAVQAIWVRYSLGLDKDALPTATSHHDSMLFAVAFSMLIVLFLEQRTRRSARWALALLPILALGMSANNRRLVWVEIAMSLLVIFLLSPRTRLKLKLQRIAVACIPVAVLYLAAGWNSGSRVFAPVAKIRSVVDSNSDRSTRERDVENYNLIVNLIRHPVIPIGFGHEYEQVSMGDDISHIFPQWKYIPHNSALGLFAFSGIAGFTAAWSVITVGVFFAARAFARARDPVWRAAALTSIATVVVYLIQCYGDMGFVSFHSVFLLAPSLAVTGKLSAACGAWRTHRAQS